MKYVIQKKKIDLSLSEEVFSPSPHGTFALGRAIKINPGEKVLDIGTGTGLFAIFAAKCGGIISATDISPQAVDLTKLNSRTNKVFVDVKQGDLFSPFKDKKFDVIIANVPQENLSPKIRKSMNYNKRVGLDGGHNGNEFLLKVLKNANRFMHKHSRLYIAVYTLSNFRESLDVIKNNYSAKLINFFTGPVKDFVYLDIKWYSKHSAKGDMYIYKKGKKYWADIFTLELTLLKKK